MPAADSTGLSVNGHLSAAGAEGCRRDHRTTSQSTNPFGGELGQQAQGSGFVYDTQGHVVTNQHVVDGGTSISVTFWNGKTYQAEVVGSDPSTDLAVLKVDAAGVGLDAARTRRLGRARGR